MDVSEEGTGFTGVVEVASYLGSITEFKVEFNGSFLPVVHTNTGNREVKKQRTGDKVSLRFEADAFPGLQNLRFPLGQWRIDIIFK